MKALIDYMAKRGINQKELAAKLEVNPTTVNRWVKGTRQPKLDTLKMFSKKLRIPLADLL